MKIKKITATDRYSDNNKLISKYDKFKSFIEGLAEATAFTRIIKCLINILILERGFTKK